MSPPDTIAYRQTFFFFEPFFTWKGDLWTFFSPFRHILTLEWIPYAVSQLFLDKVSTCLTNNSMAVDKLRILTLIVSSCRSPQTAICPCKGGDVWLDICVCIQSRGARAGSLSSCADWRRTLHKMGVTIGPLDWVALLQLREPGAPQLLLYIWHSPPFNLELFWLRLFKQSRENKLAETLWSDIHVGVWRSKVLINNFYAFRIFSSMPYKM